MYVLSHVPLFVTPWTVYCPMSMGFFRQEDWSGLPFPTQRIFPTQRSNPSLLCLLYWQADSLPLVSARKIIITIIIKRDPFNYESHKGWSFLKHFNVFWEGMSWLVLNALIQKSCYHADEIFWNLLTCINTQVEDISIIFRVPFLIFTCQKFLASFFFWMPICIVFSPDYPIFLMVILTSCTFPLLTLQFMKCI